MVRIPIQRDNRERFKDRAKYFDSHLKSLQAPDRPLCKLLDISMGVVRAAGESPDPWNGLPWLTPIIGSGCLDMPDDPYFDADGFREAVGAAVGALTDTDAGERELEFEGLADDFGFAEAENAESFAVGLLRDRVQTARTGTAPARDPDASPAVSPEITPLAARVTTFACVLTQFFFGARAAREALPLSRWDQDVAEFVRTPSSAAEHSQLVWLVQLAEWHGERAVEELKAVGPHSALPREVSDAIMSLLSEAKADIAGPGGVTRSVHRVRMPRLRLVTEVAWYLLTSEMPVYPGWTDLLLGLMLRDHTGTGDHSRPQFRNLNSATRLLPELLGAASRRSWDTSPETSSRSRFYAAVARVLWTQDQVISSVGTTRKLPPASAFVTSFDLELEAALWRTAPEGTSFFVAIPVHVFANRWDHLAAPCWLRGEIRKDSLAADPFETLKTPVGWKVLSATTTAAELRAGPHVVRLSGAPLIELPTSSAEREQLSTDLLAVGVNVDPESMVIEHALTLDEYLAVQQSEAELLLSTIEEKDAATRGTDRGLPQFLRASSMTRDGDGLCPRFWMAFGVPIGDPAVRHRLVSQIARKRVSHPEGAAAGSERTDVTAPDVAPDAASPLFQSEGPPAHEPSPAAESGTSASDETAGDLEADRLHGVIVNRRIGDDEASLLYWIGFDVVEERASAFIDDLLHYAGHLAHGGLSSWPMDPLERCELTAADSR